MMRSGTPGRGLPIVFVLAAALILVASFWPLRIASGDETDAGHARGPYLALAAGAWTVDLIGVSDAGPRPHGHAGGQAEVGWLWGVTWATSASFRWGGAWFEYDAFVLPRGRLNEETWMLRFIVDRRFVGTRGRSAWFGAGYVYGEARSDLIAIINPAPPPPNFFSGGLARAGTGFPLTGPLEIYGELEAAVIRGRGGNPAFQERYRWLGQALAVHVGFRLARRVS